MFRCGPLIDLCRGPHVRHTGKIKALKIHKVSNVTLKTMWMHLSRIDMCLNFPWFLFTIFYCTWNDVFSCCLLTGSCMPSGFYNWNPSRGDWLAVITRASPGDGGFTKSYSMGHPGSIKLWDSLGVCAFALCMSKWIISQVVIFNRTQFYTTS